MLNDATLRNYTGAAVLWLKHVVPGLHSLNIGDTSQNDKLHPCIGDTISMRGRWQQPKPKRQPYTGAMYDTLHARVSAAVKAHKANIFLKEACILDWVRLGVFTGSRGNEYVQTSNASRTKFSKVPDEPSSGPQRNMPIAFYYEDFTFYQRGKHIPLHELSNPKSQPDEVHIRFRFDKSPQNFSVRKYRTTTHPILNPVHAAMCIVLRARQLKVPPMHL